MKLYFSARIVSLVDEAVTEDVDRIGPIKRWDRRDSGKVVLYTYVAKKWNIMWRRANSVKLTTRSSINLSQETLIQN